MGNGCRLLRKLNFPSWRKRNQVLLTLSTRTWYGSYGRNLQTTLLIRQVFENPLDCCPWDYFGWWFCSLRFQLDHGKFEEKIRERKWVKKLKMCIFFKLSLYFIFLGTTMYKREFWVIFLFFPLPYYLPRSNQVFKVIFPQYSHWLVRVFYSFYLSFLVLVSYKIFCHAILSMSR